MPQLYPYRLFISHAWSYNAEYYALEQRLLEHPNFDFRNYSVPRHDPFETGTQLATKLLHQMNPTQVVIVLAGMYAAHSDWIQFEINEAKRMVSRSLAFVRGAKSESRNHCKTQQR